MFISIKKIMAILMIISFIFSLECIETKNVMAKESNIEIKLQTIQSNYIRENNITKEKGLRIVKSKVKLGRGLHFLYDSERNIKGKNYHLYTINTDQYTYDEYAYCVDVNSGKLFKCLKNMSLLPIK